MSSLLTSSTPGPTRRPIPLLSTRKSRLALILGGWLLAVTVNGCTPLAVVGGAGATAATASQQEKGLRVAIDDARIQTEINHLLFQKNVELFSEVGLLVNEGRVLITGAVDKPETRIATTRLAWQATGVREVINELQVTTSNSLIDRVRDVWINTQLRGKLIVDKNIQSINYSIDTVNGVVYLLGIAQNQVELDRIIGLARDLGYVRNVVSYVRVKT